MSKTLKLSGMCLSVILAGCANDPAPFDLRTLQQPERTSALEVKSEKKRPLPTTLESPFLSTNPEGALRTMSPATGPALENDVTLRLPLQEIIHRAVINNLDVKVAGYQPAIDETRVTQAEARFDPSFFNNFKYQRQDTQSGFGYGSGNGRMLTDQVGLRQNMPSGGTAEFRYESGFTEPFKQPGGVPSPNQFWSNQVVLEVTQPVLQNFGNEINRAQIVINRNNQRISLLDFRKQLEQTVLDIEKDYWQLVNAVAVVKFDEDLLNRTIDTGEVLFKRQNQDVTRVQLSQANSSIESRRAVLIRAKAHVRDLSDDLKRLMNDPNMPVSSGALILPANKPSEVPIIFDLNDQISTALENRFELGQQQLRVDSAEVARKVAKNNLLPSLNVVGSVGVQGLAPGLVSVFKEQLESTSLNYSIGLQLEIPIGNREARSIYRRALLQREQALFSYQSLTDQIALDVKQAVREVDTTWEEMAATRQATFAADDALKAIQQRELGGEALTPTFVQLKLDAQERLAQAQTNEAQAISNYNIAIASLEKAKGTLLRYDNIMMDEQMLPNAARP